MSKGNSPASIASADHIADAGKMIQTNVERDMDTRGRVTWLSSGEGEGPDVGLTLGLGNGVSFYIGDLDDTTLAESGIDLAVYPNVWWVAIYTRTGVSVIGPVADSEVAREAFDHLSAALNPGDQT